ncbi:gliding motility-associated C-terminal domain-containing protein [Cesiribacter sp. SM1]|uniref:DUF7619 domain-containing protein n=1 Tax=Cesiribacter sp. SM1 TaxID=2861196 RepID=UPI001CD4D26F|nr:gliding motility-associated C-terminal domain-containing protein [Cesiribacter sp. SM1]
MAGTSLFAQEAFAPEQLYFQGEVIRKVSVGHNAVWVVKGQDSTGVGKLDMQGIEHDYTSRINTTVPLTGIVGKYGDSAMIATRGNYLLLYDKGKITQLDESYGVRSSTINDIAGTVRYSYFAMDNGYQETYDNVRFNPLQYDGARILRVSSEHRGTSAIAYPVRDEICAGSITNALRVLIRENGEISLAAFNLDQLSDLHAIAAFNGYPNLPVTVYAGHSKGLKIRFKDCFREIGSALQDTAVYAIKNYGETMLIGTDKGLFYTAAGEISITTHAIDLGADYEIFDIAVDQENGVVWLGTDQGLLKISEEYKAPTTALAIGSISWAKSLGSSFTDSPKAMATDKKGNVYVTGSFSGMVNFGDSVLISQTQESYFLAKYTADGKFLWVRSATHLEKVTIDMTGSGITLAVDDQENVYAVVSYWHKFGYKAGDLDFGFGIKPPPPPTLRNSIMVKYNAAGTTQWAKHIEGASTVERIQLETDQAGNLYLSKFANETRIIYKYNSAFEQEWLRTYPPNFDFFKLNQNGEFYLSGSFNHILEVGKLKLYNRGVSELVVLKLNQNGMPIWGTQFGDYVQSFSNAKNITDITSDVQGNVYVTGQFELHLSIDTSTAFYVQPGNRGIFYAKINPIGRLEWVRCGETGDEWPSQQILVDSVGHTILMGRSKKNLKLGEFSLEGAPDKSELYMVKFDSGGNLSWSFSIPGVTNDNYAAKFLAKGVKNHLFLYGQLSTNNLLLNGNLLQAKGPTNIFLAKVSDPTSKYNEHVVRGKTFFDENKNGRFDDGDEPIADHIIKSEPGPLYTKSDQNGNYEFYLQQGDYTLEQIIPNLKGRFVKQTAPSQPYVLKLSSTKVDTSGFDFANDVKVSPFLSVDVTSTRFRRCFTNTTKVEYCNEGYADARNVELVLEYPDYVIPIASSIPWTSKTGNKYTFQIGAMAAQSCRTITLKDSVICGNESIRGLTQCIKAYILPPNTTLNTHPDWDGSDVELTAVCKDNGFVRVGFRNSGEGSMADSASFSIHLDQQQVYSGKYKLKAGEDLSLNLLANGKPLHLEAQLTPHHPEKRTVSITIQGCNNGGAGIINGGYVNQFPQNDEAENIEMLCLPIIDSYDPNDKRVAPAGITATNNIAEDSQLEYTIRFQNTGTDTAYTVVVVDPLSEHLDISTLKVGIASHPVQWEISRDNQPSIIWRFKKINLPDSTTNERASHGFVKFKISPKEGLPKGTIIRNKADIYFDYNSPIITNEVFNTLGLPEPSAGEKVLVQNCNTRIDLQQEADAAVVLCGGASSYQLSRQLPVNGRGMWKVSKGTAVLADPFNHQTLATNLSFGENEFSWIVTYCDQVVSSKVTVIREQPLEKPQVQHPEYICQGDTYPAITATGEGIEWYRDEALTQLALKGNTYQPSGQESETLYVIQRNEHCSSAATVVPVLVHEPPLPPVTTPVEACVEVAPPVLTAQGSTIRWYADAGKQQLLAEGDSFSPADKSSRSYWATQSSEYCESQPAEVVFTAKHFDPAKAYIANVVTPNGDGKNQLYYVKDFEGRECMGEFISIRIYNRWGKQVYESKAADFRWDASALPVGVYYYRMNYQLNKFQGAIQVLR